MAHVTHYEIRCYDLDTKEFIPQHTDSPHTDGCMIEFTLSTDAGEQRFNVPASLPPEEAKASLDSTLAVIDANALAAAAPAQTHDWLQEI